MIELRINDHHVTLLPDTQVQMELVSPLFADGIEDSFSMPIDIPVRGSEIALGHVHQLASKLRNIDIPDVRLEVDGAPLSTGDLNVIGSDGSTVNATFGLDALAVRLKGRLMPELIKELVIPIEQDQGLGDPNGLRPGYAFGGDCQFPMHYNPALYGDANPDWFPAVSEWDATIGYAVNALVNFTSHLQDAWQLERTTPWECISTTAPNESPLSHPSKWKKTAYGIVNAWDHDTHTFKANTTDGNFYALVPWFYTKWLLKKLMLAVGYAAIGDFLMDPRTDELLVPNTSTIDVPTVSSSTHFFQATDDTHTIPYNPTASGVFLTFRIHGSDDSTIPNQDTEDLWSTSTHAFTCPGAGDYTFKLTANFTMFVVPPWTGNVQIQGRIQRHDGTVVASAPCIVDWAGQQVVDGAPYHVTHCHALVPVTFSSGDIGDNFHFNIVIVEFGTTNVLWPATTSDKYLYGQVRGWLNDAAQDVATPNTVIYPHRHVPNVELSQWLIGLSEAFNLCISPDTASRTIRFDYRESAVNTTTTGVPDETKRLNGPIALDHSRRTEGMRLKWSLDDLTKEIVDPLETLETCVSELELSVPLVADDRRLLLNTRQLLKSSFKAGDFFWTDTGYYVPDVVFGDPDNTTDVDPAMKPLHMQRHSIDGRDLLIPVLSAEGASDFFHTDGDQSGMWMCLFVYGTIGPATIGGDVPTLEIQGPQARSWGYAWHDYDPAALALNWRMDNSAPLYATAITPYTEFHQKWMEAIVNAEPVTLDLRVDQPFILAKNWHRPLLLDHQRILVQRLPVTLTNNRAVALATDVQALRLREGVPLFQTPNYLPVEPIPDVVVFAPAGFNNTVFSVRYLADDFVMAGGAFTASGATTLGRIAKLNPDGTLNSVFTFNSGTGFNNQVACIEIQSDGKLLVGGNFTSYNGIPCGRIARLNPNGTFDATFNAVGVGADGAGSVSIHNINFLSDGTIVASGFFDTFNGVSTKTIVALDPSGTISTSFLTGIGFSNGVSGSVAYGMTVDDDDNIYVCGNFGLYKGGSCQRVIKILPNGNRDTSFSIPTVTYSAGGDLFNYPKVQPDGKIMLVGNMATYGGVPVQGLIRVSQTGALDTAFVSTLAAALPAGFGIIHSDIALDPSGKIYFVNSQLFVINPDGSVFTQTYLGSGASARIYDITLKEDESQVLIGGQFSSVNGVSALRIYSFDL